MRKIMMSLLPVLVVSAALTGCAPEQAPAPEKSVQASTPAAEEKQDKVAEESAKEAGIDLTNLGAPLATAEVPIAVKEDPKATMTVAFYGLERQGETLVGTFSFSPKTSASDRQTLFSYLGKSHWAPYLIDPVNLNKHSVLKGTSSGEARTTTGAGDVTFGAGQTYYAYAMFAAPPAGVDEMNVSFIEGAPLVVGVPLQ